MITVTDLERMQYDEELRHELKEFIAEHSDCKGDEFDEQQHISNVRQTSN